MSPPALFDISEALLGAAVAALGALAPARAFVAHNAPAWDLCVEDQLTVHLSSLSFKQSRGPKAFQSVPNPLWTIQVVRCTPGVTNEGTSPPVGSLEDSAEELMTDLDVIQQYVRSDALAIFGGCTTVVYGQALPLGPSGNVGGYSWPISAEVTGTAPLVT